jgi:predicted nucleotidyltransferase
MTDLIKKSLPEIRKICQEENVSYLALFGSQARGEAKPKSDVDMLVKFKESYDCGVANVIRTEDKLSQLLKKDVDLVPTDSLDKYIAPYIQDDLKVIYE